MKTHLILITLISGLACSCFGSPDVLKFWDSYDARKEPLNVEVVKAWETEEGNFQLIRYDLGRLSGSNRSASPKIAAYYGCPKWATGVPGIVHIHGGGQRAESRRVEQWVKLGYACISINWGARVLEEVDTPNTDWDGLAAGFIRPGITKEDGLDHHNFVRGDEHTLYKEQNTLNSSWILYSICARRALTFLEQRSEVDADRLGVEGHSMGGRLSVLTANDPRIKAVSPSVGGSGYLYDDLWGLPGSGRRMTKEDGLDLYNKTVSCRSYWPHIKAPILFLGASDDFNSPTEWVVKGMSQLPAQTERMLVLAPHLNHRFTTKTAAARFMWMEAHLKGNFTFPKPSRSTLKLDTSSGVPLFTVQVDESAGMPIEKVEIYYGYARDPRIRFWRSATVTQSGKIYSGACPVFDCKEPLYAFANITYKMDRTLPARPGKQATDLVTVSSEYQMARPDALQAAGVKATEKQQRIIDDFSRGWQDWYRLNIGNQSHWFYATRKLLDPSFMGPKGGKLAVDVVTTAAGNTMAVCVDVNRWQSYTGRKKDSYFAFVDLPVDGLNAIQLRAADFKNEKGEAMRDWDEITELYFTPSNRIKSKLKMSLDWKGRSPELLSLRWEGGTIVKRPYPHQPRGGSVVNVVEFADEFQSAIDDSVKLEEQDAKKIRGAN